MIPAALTKFLLLAIFQVPDHVLSPQLRIWPHEQKKRCFSVAGCGVKQRAGPPSQSTCPGSHLNQELFESILASPQNHRRFDVFVFFCLLAHVRSAIGGLAFWAKHCETNKIDFFTVFSIFSRAGEHLFEMFPDAQIIFVVLKTPKIGPTKLSYLEENSRARERSLWSQRKSRQEKTKPIGSMYGIFIPTNASI